jgi:hypothetical protein
MTSEPESPSENEPSVRASLAMVRDIAFVVAVYVYFTGFTYYYYWRLLLGIPVAVADEPVFHIFVYAFQVFRIYWAGILGCIVAGVLLWVAVGSLFDKIAWLHAQERLRSGLSILLLVAIVLGLFTVLSVWSEEAARIHVDSVRAGYTTIEPNIKIMLKPEFKRYFDQDFVYDNEHFCLTLVGETTDAVYALSQALYQGEQNCLPYSTRPGSKLPYGFVYAVPKSDIVSMIVEQGEDPVPNTGPQ